jgi:hypothetical protein
MQVGGNKECFSFFHNLSAEITVLITLRCFSMFSKTFSGFGYLVSSLMDILASAGHR